jgi:DNA-binding NtrC family response regulator
VLVVDDDRGVRHSLRRALLALGYDAHEASDGDRALLRLEEDCGDLLFVDYRMPGLDGMEVTRRAKRLCPHLYVVLMTGFASYDVAVEAVKHGADDFLGKPFTPERLRAILHKAQEHGLIQRRRLPANGDSPLPNVVGSSPPMQAVYRQIRRIAPGDETVLITGETGTGKELAARAIHFWSPRSRQPFVTVNCSALTDSILESQLFGHERGSFTGAEKQTTGLIEEAHGGTLFLDEIGDASLKLQTSLLRVLQEGQVRRVGASEDRAVNVRVVAATNKPLDQAIKAGTFRSDLYYRLSVFPIPLPPLRERPSDLPLLIAHFLQRCNAADHSFDPAALDALQRYPWPGNVRELEHLVHRLVVLVDDSVIRPEHLPPQYRAAAPGAVSVGAFQESKHLFERQFFEDLLRRTHGSVAEAARLASLSRHHLHEKLHKLDLDPDQFRHGRRDGPEAEAPQLPTA